jgi:hypothetical protein
MISQLAHNICSPATVLLVGVEIQLLEWCLLLLAATSCYCSATSITYPETHWVGHTGPAGQGRILGS